jgi:hypothetical protein
VEVNLGINPVPLLMKGASHVEIERTLLLETRTSSELKREIVRADDSPESAPSCIKKLPDEFDGEIEKRGYLSVGRDHTYEQFECQQVFGFTSG